jgi:hypothetical protein
MAIETSCSGCGSRLRVDDQYAGKQARCPRCGAVYTVPVSGFDVTPADATVPPRSVPSGDSASDAIWFLRTPEGQSYGPADKATLDQWMTEGRISHDCQLRRGTFGDWMPAWQTYPNLVSAPRPPEISPLRRDVSSNPYSAPMAGPAHREPHRGGLIFVLGILGFVISCPIFGAFAWVMGSRDLKKIRAGRMDPQGKGLTQAGMILGIISLALWALTIFGMLLFFGAANMF